MELLDDKLELSHFVAFYCQHYFDKLIEAVQENKRKHGKDVHLLKK